MSFRFRLTLFGAAVVALTLFTFGLPYIHRAHSIPWQPISMRAPPPERSTS